MMLQNKRLPKTVKFTDDEIILVFDDGSSVGNPLAWFPFLQSATREQRENCKHFPLSIDWEILDDGLDIEGMLRGIKPRYSQAIIE